MVLEYTYLAFMLSSNYNFSTLNSSFPAYSGETFPKCCPDHQTFSIAERKCISTDSGSREYENSATYSGLSNLENKCGYSPSKFQAGFLPPIQVAEFDKFSDNGSVNVRINNEFRHFERYMYCLEEENKEITPILIGCEAQQSPDSVPEDFSSTSVMDIDGWFFLISLLLIVITFGIHLVNPELRKEVQHKCLLCYLATLILIIILPFIGLSVSMDLESSNGFFEFIFIWMVHLSWLNVMSIHLWCTVTTINSTSLRSFYAYVSYTIGLPLICLILYIADKNVSSNENFSSREEGVFLLRPEYFYFFNVLLVQQCMNLLIFFRVGYIIWNQKLYWNVIREGVGSEHLRQLNKWLHQLVKLFVLTSSEWSFCFCIIDTEKTGYLRLLDLFSLLYPGFSIFITYVLCNKNAISIRRKRFSNLRDSTHELEIRDS